VSQGNSLIARHSKRKHQSVASAADHAAEKPLISAILQVDYCGETMHLATGPSYALHLTRKRETMLAKPRKRIPLHESTAAALRTAAERAQLRHFFEKLAYG
jgi:hypothetical protein